MCMFNKREKSGFTLLEIIIAVALFAVVAVVALGALLTSTTANRKSKTERIALDNIGFALDDITYNVRFGKVYDCAITATPTDGECLLGSDSLSLLVAAGTPVIYRFNGSAFGAGRGAIQRSSDNVNWVNLTDPLMDVDDVIFYVRNALAATPQRFPRVLVTVRGTAVISGDQKSKTPFAVQTTITRRFGLPQ